MRWKLSPAIPSAETLRIYACQLAADQGLADHSPGTGKKQRSTVLKHHNSSSKTETDTQQKPLTASGTAATPTQNTPDKPTNSANSSPKNAKNAFFQPGNGAIWIQVLLIAIQAIASAIALYSIGEIISLVFFSDGKILLQTWITAGAMWIAVAAVGSFLLGIVQRSSMHSESLRMRQGLLHQAFRLGPARFNGAETGSILSTLTDSVERVTAYRQGYIGQLFGAVLTPFLTLAVIAFFIDWLSAVILFLCIPLVPLAIGGFQQLFRQDSNTSRQMREQLAGQFLEAIQGLPTLVGINAAKTTGEKLANTGEANRVALMRLLARNQLLLFVMEAVFSLFLVTLAIVLAYLRFQAGALSIGGSFALILLTTQLTTPINEVGGFFYIGLGGRAGMRAIRDFMQRESNWQKQHCQLAANPGELAENFISLDGINFSYDGKTKVLRNLDLQVPAGTTTVLLGKSGGGKSTLLSIIGGDLVPAEGDIRIGGVELCADTQDEIRAKSAVVRQQTWLFPVR
ncbi:ABC transporter transmembrane domain-containing protein [Arcanobacterium hippocoleae]|uniref:ABC transporter transmembrane domain-containing protein n=1 Tax=Arcanobacterium hippocoleae TaxID=149017 RepID=UPI0033421E28